MEINVTSSRAEHVRIYEVGPRDGLQNETTFIPTEDKISLVQALIDAGLDRVEATSFVHPRWIPALADADAVAQHFSDHLESHRISMLVPNARGMDRALKANVKEIAVFMSASELHNKRNINKTRDETYLAFEPVFEQCDTHNIKVRAYVSVVWGCPYEGKVDPKVSADIAARLIDMGAYEVSLGDTIGVGNPAQTLEVINAVSSRVDLSKIAMHMHDTWGRALANCLTGLNAGVRTFDASIGGLGGCPYAPGASGNLSTEDLVSLLHTMGYETNVSWERLIKAGALAQSMMERELPSRALKAELASCV